MRIRSLIFWRTGAESPARVKSSCFVSRLACAPMTAVWSSMSIASQTKGRISTAAPRTLACPIHCLRPILHIACPNSMLSYSKGSRGLFVPSRVIGIFTDTTISLSSRLRQRPDHYTIRAGRNLPDKEFRYLRTVIVTAAVYWGFNSTLLLSMTSPLNLPAPGRCQAVYVYFHIGTALCFC